MMCLSPGNTTAVNIAVFQQMYGLRLYAQLMSIRLTTQNNAEYQLGFRQTSRFTIRWDSRCCVAMLFFTLLFLVFFSWSCIVISSLYLFYCHRYTCCYVSGWRPLMVTITVWSSAQPWCNSKDGLPWLFISSNV